MVRRPAAVLLIALLGGSLAVGACGSSSSPSSGKAANVVLGSPTTQLTLSVSPASAAAGDVTFSVKNAGNLEHELIVLKTDVAFDKLPIVDAGDPPAPVTTGANKVDEANSVGELGAPNLKPGESRSFTIKGLAAGKYVLLCNLEGHYSGGMRVAFTVV